MLIDDIVALLEQKTSHFTPPLIDQIIKECGHDPFLILISCLLSLRAKDSTTIHVCRDLFKIVRTPQQLYDLPAERLEAIIFKTGFYRNKAKIVQEVCRHLIQQHGGVVPDTEEMLRGIKGIGPKTANLVMAAAFGAPAVCVDTHVHRISNRLGLINTTTVEDSERSLRKVLPQRYWSRWNTLLVMWGQNVCVPISPHCSRCSLAPLCQKKGVVKSR